MQILTLSKEKFDVLRCQECDCYLSVGPVMILGNKPTCGRCVAKYPNAPGYLSEFFELSASIVSNWPCRYDANGCPKTFKWNSATSHEQFCDYRSIWCPAIGCNNFLRRMDLKRHFLTDHKNLILAKQFFEVSSSYNQKAVRINVFIEIMDMLFVIKKRFTTHGVFISISCIDDFEQLFCYFNIVENNNTINVCQHISQYTEKYDVDDITMEEELYSHYNYTDPAIFTFMISNFLQNEKVLNDKILSELQCPICSNFIRPPIISCENGHITCEDCIEKWAKLDCCLCGAPLVNRHTVLQNIAEKLCYPCKFQNDGCNISDHPAQIVWHEAKCSLRQNQLQTCYLEQETGCQWSGPYSDLSYHFLMIHSEQFVQLGKPIKVLLSQLGFMTLFSNFDDEFIKFNVHYDKKNGLNFSANLKSNLDKILRYKFFLEFGEHKTTEVDILDENSVLIKSNYIKPLVRNNEFSFIIKILKA